MATKTAIAEFVQRGDNIDYKADKDIAYMEVVPLAARIGVALEAIEKGDTGTLTLTGAFKVPAVAGTAFAAGEKVYWDAANGNVTTTAGDVVAGYTVEAKAEAAVTAIVRIG